MNKVNERESPVLYSIVVLAAVISTWLLHEFAHWCAGELLGNPMIMTLNTCYPATGRYEHPWHEHVISAAGPMVTLLQAFIFYRLIKKQPGKLLFPFLLTCLYMRALAGMMNLIHLNDEGRISKALGIGSFTIPFLMFGILFYLVYDVVGKKEFSGKRIALTVLLIMIFSSGIILSDQSYGITLINR